MRLKSAAIVKQNSLIIFTAVVLGVFISGAGLCSDINLKLNQESVNDNVFITLENNSVMNVEVVSVSLDLDGKRYEQPYKKQLLPAEKVAMQCRVQMPNLRGSYPLIVTVKYLNDGKTLTLRHLGLFYYQERAVLASQCSTEETSINKEGIIKIRSATPAVWKLILPEEIKVLSSSTFDDYKAFRVKNEVQGFKVNYPFFGVAERIDGGKHYTASCAGILQVDTRDSSAFKGGRTGNKVLACSALIFLLAAYYALKKAESKKRFAEALGKYASRMFLVSFAYLILKNLPQWAELSLSFFEWGPYRYFARTVIDNFQSINYKYFFEYFVDVFFAANLIFLLPFLFYSKQAQSVDEDKYTALVRTILSLKDHLNGRRLYWNKYSKLGFLTFCVKFFYVPLLASWVINNTIHQKNLIVAFKWDIYALNAYLVALFIYMDTIVFFIGYLVESRPLKNVIKTVEPTVFGWVVCLWCYPPFNVFSFKIFDYPIVNLSHAYPEWIHLTMTCVITLLWGIFVWASLSLGFKASNLTNRGIIRTGPYRFMRHPAYAAKLLLWYIQGIFLGQFTLGIMLGFTLIYVLRAWTEERHLSADPDYVQYKKEVPGAFSPSLNLAFLKRAMPASVEHE